MLSGDNYQNNGHWVPNNWVGPDLITAVGMALAKQELLRAENASLWEAIKNHSCTMGRHQLNEALKFAEKP